MMKKIWETVLIGSSVLWLFLPFPWVLDSWGWGKNWLLVVLGLINLLVWLIYWIKEGMGRVKTGMVGWWWFLVIVSMVTTILVTNYPGVRLRGLVATGGVAVMAAVGIWWWLWQQMEIEAKKKMIAVMAGGGVLLSLMSTVIFLLPQNILPFRLPADNPWLVIDTNWSPTGSVMAEFVVLAIVALILGQRLINKIKKGNKYLVWAIMEIVVVVGLAVDGYKIWKGAWAWLPLDSAWAIALETLKREPWLGTGWGNFGEAFNLYRPAGYNLGPMWATAFRNSTVTVLQWITEAGILGLLAAGWGLILGLRRNEKGKRNFFILAGVVAIILMPVVNVGWWIVAWLLALKSETKEKEVVLLAGEKKTNLAPLMVAGMVVLLVVGVGVGWTRLMLAERAIKLSLVAAAKNQAQPTYDWQRKAIGLNPWDSEYRRLYSQTNLAIAQSTLAKENPNDQEKQQAAVLIQQAVNEAKAAIALDGMNSAYWANLAVIYRSLVGLVDGAADWSYESYNQAVALDPTNPLLKLNLGGLLYAANRFEDADRTFEGVVTSKPDLANGWYNWAYAAKKQDKLADAVSRLNQAVALVPANSGDFDKATQELAEWKKELEALAVPTPVVKEAETLTTPEPLPSVSPDEKPEIDSQKLEPPLGAVIPTLEPTLQPNTNSNP